MHATPSRPARARLRMLATAAVWSLLASACAAPGPKAPERIDAGDATGFTITEKVHIRAGVRADFAQAVALLDQGRRDTAIGLLVDVTRQAPEAATPRIDLGIAYREAGDLEKARESLESARELAPRHPVALNELGIVYRRLGRFADARASYEQALAAHPEFHFARKNLGILCDLYLRDPECALRQYSAYLEAVPDDPAAAMWIADLRSRTGKQGEGR